jgi:3D (Asp-Asp-Asp) domain-containing protein
MDISLKLIKILVILAIISLNLLIPTQLKFHSPEANFSLIENSNLKTSEYLTIQGNSLLPISSPNLDEFSLIKTTGGKTIIATVTGYTLSKEETDEEPCIIASGLNACEINKNIVACPRKYLFGTKVLIEGKIYVCEDRTNIKYDGIFDILFKNKEEMNNWGKRILPVTILN